MSKNKPLIITIIVVIVLVILLVVSSTGTTISKGAGTAGGVFSPVQEFFYQISSSVGSFFDGLVNKDSEQSKNKELQNELEVFKSKSREYEELKKENERLAKLLEYKQENPEQELKVAKITGKNPSNWFDVFTINLGRKDGVKENMPVITADGLVGRVEEVGLNSAKVMAIIDGRSSVSAIMERTRDHVVVKGAIANNVLDVALNITYLPIYSDIIEGDKIITSGTDNIYPKGFLIGEVAKAENTEATGKNVKITPAVDFRRLEEVFVVMAADGSETGAISAANEVIVGSTEEPAPSSAPAPQE
ncbi:MAG: rod shape-determining protein MreC [Christensenella sp.]